MDRLIKVWKSSLVTRKVFSVLAITMLVVMPFAQNKVVFAQEFFNNPNPPKPDLVITKSNNLDGGHATVGVPFNWILTISNTGAATASFENNEKVFKDEIPNSGATYGTPTYTFAGGAHGSDTTCGISGNALGCTSHNSHNVSIPVGGTMTVTLPVTPTTVGSLRNPRNDHTCKVDQEGNKIHESNENNNNCNVDTVTVDPAGGTLTIIKHTVGDNGTFNFDVTGAAATSTSITTADNTGEKTMNLPAGGYSVNEAAVEGWTQAGASCTGDTTPNQFSIPSGGNVTCTFTNTKDAPPVDPTGSIEITKYGCPDGTAVTRSENGVGGTVPDGCSPQSGKTFGYVHGVQEDANGPYPELDGPFIEGGVTDGDGVLTIGNLSTDGRYLVIETDGSGNKLPNEDVLGLYCMGDGDTSNNNDNQELTFVAADQTVKCVAYDKVIPPPAETATVIATKIVCENEADLPNWGEDDEDTNASITADTAADYVAGHEGCHLQSGWQFEWAPNGTANPGDNIGIAGGPWTTSGLTDANGVVQMTVPASEGSTWFREVPQDGYIPFSGWISNVENTPTTEDEFSAEMYCNNDVLNYDNYDWINGVKEGGTYYCVAWNVSTQKPPESCRVDVVSAVGDEGVGNDNAVAAWIHSSWTHALESVATWIWDTPEVLPANMLTDEDKTFTKDFYVDGPVNDATLNLAADNRYWITINGDDVVSNTGEFNYGAVTGPIDVASYVDSGWNTIMLKVENIANGSTDPHANPAAGIYQLVVNGEAQTSCEQPPSDDDVSDVTVCKYQNSIDDDNLLDGWNVWLDGYVGDTLSTYVSNEHDYLDVTGESENGKQTGCVTFDNVPYGSYTLGEDMQDGWENVTGVEGATDAGAVVEVNEPTQTFNLVNALTCNPEVNLIQNGSFEDPEVTHGDGWDIFPSGTSDLDWTVSWRDPFVGAPLTANAELHRGVNGWQANNGMQYTELDSDWNGHAEGPNGEEASVILSQAVPTIPGRTYELSYAFSPRPGTAAAQNSLEASEDGNVLNTVPGTDGSANTNTAWTTYTDSFVAGDASTDIAFKDLGTPNSEGTFLDDVRMYCIPKGEEHHNEVTVCKYEEGEEGGGLPGWTVMLLGDQVDQVTVYPDGPNPLGNTYSSVALPAGDYVVRANGSYIYRPDAVGSSTDAAFTMRSPSGDPFPPSGPYSPWVAVNNLTGYEGYLGLTVNGALGTTNWGSAFNPLHEYALGLSTAGGPVDFNIADDNHGDNSGHLTATINEGYVGVTGENGCVTFTDVALGDYSVEEIMQSGWHFSSGPEGLQSIDSDEGSYHFNIFNERDEDDGGGNGDNEGSITIDKVVAGEGANGDLEFGFDLGWVDADQDMTLSANDAPEVISGLGEGSYTITELTSDSDDWYVTDITCDNENYYHDTGEADVEIVLGENEHVTCTFTNTYRPEEGGNGDDGGGTSTGGGGGDGSNNLGQTDVDGSVLGASTAPGEVLGDQIAMIPEGAPNTGSGGAVNGGLYGALLMLTGLYGFIRSRKARI